MPSEGFSDADLLAFLDEMLPVDRAATIEHSVRNSPELQRRMALLLRRRDQGGHTVGEIWRRRQLSCPSRSELGSYVLGVLDEAAADYIEFHLQSIGCRICLGNLEDLRTSQQSEKEAATRRSQRFFQSSAGVLRSRRER